MEIIEAYCEELMRVVEIYEVQEEYFAQPSANRHRFKFRCSDPACRAAKNPLVVGVNYHKNAEESDKYQQLHFKSHTNHPHIGTCVWVVRDAGKREENPSGNERVDVRHPRPKATNVVDVFEPPHSDTLLGAASADARPPTVVSNDAPQEDGGQVGFRTGTTTTSRLEKLIDCWSNIDLDVRRHNRITIDGRTLTYYQLCLHIITISEEEIGSRVVYGGAHVKAWPKDKPTHYYIKFFDECDRFPEVGGDKSLTISLPIKRLKQSRRGALLTKRIEQASQPNHYLKVYAWGDIKARTGNKKGYELEVAALDNLVLKVIKKKSEELK